MDLTPPLSVRLSVTLSMWWLSLNLKTAKYIGVTISPRSFRLWAWRTQRKRSLTRLSTFKDLQRYVRARNLSMAVLEYRKFRLPTAPARERSSLITLEILPRSSLACSMLPFFLDFLQ